MAGYVSSFATGAAIEAALNKANDSQSALNATQLKAVNSGITDVLVEKITNLKDYYTRDPNTIVTADSDLDDYKTPGRYGCNTGSIAATITNSPYKLSGYRLEIIETTGYNLMQKIYPNAQNLAHGLCFMRTYIANSDTWSDWYLFEATSIKTLTYTGDGGATTSIAFPETPSVILSIDGPGTGTGMVNLTSFRFGAKAVCGSWSDTQATGTKANGIFLLADTNNNTLTLSGGQNVGSRCNVNGATYTVTYM